MTDAAKFLVNRGSFIAIVSRYLQSCLIGLTPREAITCILVEQIAHGATRIHEMLTSGSQFGCGSIRRIDYKLQDVHMLNAVHRRVCMPQASAAGGQSVQDGHYPFWDWIQNTSKVNFGGSSISYKTCNNWPLAKSGPEPWYCLHKWLLKTGSFFRTYRQDWWCWVNALWWFHWSFSNYVNVQRAQTCLPPGLRSQLSSWNQQVARCWEGFPPTKSRRSEDCRV